VTKARVLLDRDRMNGADKQGVASLTASIFDRIQDSTPANQLLALAASFLLLCTASGIPAQDAFTATKNLMYDPLTRTGIAPQFQAMQFYLKEDVLNG